MSNDLDSGKCDDDNDSRGMDEMIDCIESAKIVEFVYILFQTTTFFVPRRFSIGKIQKLY